MFLALATAGFLVAIIALLSFSTWAEGWLSTSARASIVAVLLVPPSPVIDVALPEGAPEALALA